jgi:hypothetical protein
MASGSLGYGLQTDVHGQLSLGLLAAIVVGFVAVAYIGRSHML